TSLRWVRPLQGIVALFGEEIVALEVAGVHSGAATVGHRFHHSRAITIGSANDYAGKLHACHVLIDPAEREAIIRDGAAAAAAAAGLTLVRDDALVTENAGLTEWPVALLGGFDPSFLEVPREVIQLTMRTNQKYFACTDSAGAFAPNFVCVANIEAADGGAAIVAGNQKVLAARLSDAKFFWEQDLKVPLEEQAKKLGQIVFHERIGTLDQKVRRVCQIAKSLVSEGIIVGTDVETVDRAGRLAKADLVTGMVGEFPELQGVIGSYIARAQGEPAEIADAIRDHYKPTGPDDDVPTAPVTVALGVAERLYTLASFFGIDEGPTGSKDPFALRRAALGLLALITENGLRLPIARMLFIEMHLDFVIDAINAKERAEIERARLLKKLSPFVNGPQLLNDFLKLEHDRTFVTGVTPQVKERSKQLERVLAFLADRLKVQQREAGVRHDLIDAVFSLGGEDDLVRLLARVKALQSFVETREGADLLTGYRRAANILRKEAWAGEGKEAEPPSYPPAPEEAALIAALDAAEPKARGAIADEDFEGAMAALATLRAPVDAFFDKVTVNDPDPVKRATRLTLLARLRDAVHRVADFSRIEG
ncbi:MAG: glycine--tRNA ligase subunit beta, partial [Sphingomonadales bacterium]